MSQTPTFLQIDLQSIFEESRNLGQKIDFEKIWINFSGRESEFLTGAVVYLTRSEYFDSSKFESKLIRIGYNIRSKTLTESSHKGKKTLYLTSQAINITIDCLEKMWTFDKWILMSNDADFSDLCAHLKQKNKKIEIWSFKDTLHPSLEYYADSIKFIDKALFYEKPHINVFGFNWDDKLRIK